MKKANITYQLKLLQQTSSFILWAIFWCIVPFSRSLYFQDPFYTPKLIFCFLGIMATCLLLRGESFQVPVVNKPKVFFALLIFTCLYLLLYLPSDPSFLFYFLMVVASVLLNVTLIKKNGQKFWSQISLAVFFGSLICSLFSIGQIWHSFFNPKHLESSRAIGVYAVFFGNINIFAQYLALSLPFSIYLLSSSNRLKEISVFSIGIIIMLLILSVTYCRSAILSVALCLLFASYLFKNKRVIFITLFSILIVGTTLIAPSFPLKNKKLQKTKISSIQARFEHYKHSIRMVEINPLGFGIGKYAFNTFPFRFEGVAGYRKRYNERSPHSEYLKAAVEGGVFIFILYLLGSACFLLKSVKFAWGRRNDEGFIAISLVLTLFIEMNLQFPFEMVHPLLILALLMSYVIYNSQISLRKFQPPHPLIAVLIFFGVISSIVVFSHSSRKLDYYFGDFTTKMCSYQLMDWRRCLSFSQAIEKSHPGESNHILRSLLYYNPFNVHIVNEKVIRQKLLGEEANSCLGFSVQKIIYNGQSLLPEEPFSSCDPPPVTKTGVLASIKQWLIESQIEVHPRYKHLLDLVGSKEF